MLKYALIGCGRIAKNHMQAYKENSEEIKLGGVCDIVADNMENLLEQSNVELSTPRYIDYIELLEKEKPDFVAIATESGKHAQIAIDCMERGVHVIVEKPFALSMQDAYKMLKVQKKNQVVLYPCHQNRFNKSIQKLRQAVEDGRFGKLLHGTAHIRWNRNQDYYTQAPWRGTWEQDGGALMNQCIHNIDLLRWMMGNEVEEVFAYTDRLEHGYIDAEDLGLALVKFSNGSYGVIEGTTNIYPKNLEETLYIFGEKGTAKVGGASVNKIEEWRFGDDIDNAEDVVAEYKESPPNVYGFGHTSLYKDAIAAIKGEKTQYITAEDGMRALEMVLAIYQSKKTGCPIKLPLGDFSTLDMRGTF